MVYINIRRTFKLSGLYTTLLRSQRISEGDSPGSEMGRFQHSKLAAWLSDVEPLPMVNEFDDSELAVIVFPLAAFGDFFGGVPMLYHPAICEPK